MGAAFKGKEGTIKSNIKSSIGGEMDYKTTDFDGVRYE